MSTDAGSPCGGFKRQHLPAGRGAIHARDHPRQTCLQQGTLNPDASRRLHMGVQGAMAVYSNAAAGRQQIDVAAAYKAGQQPAGQGVGRINARQLHQAPIGKGQAVASRDAGHGAGQADHQVRWGFLSCHREGDQDEHTKKSRRAPHAPA